MDHFQTAPLFASVLPESPAGTTYRFHYADMADMPMWTSKPESAWDDTAWNGENKFRGGPVADSVKLARQGWPAGADKARKLHDGLQAAMPERRRLVAYGVAGAVPNMARALAGNPLNMRRMVTKETTQRPVLTLVCSICVSAAFPADSLLDHAASVAGIVDFLENAGFRCEVLTVARFTDKINGEVAVRLKAPEQPLNLATMAYGLGHPAFLRRLIFGILQADSAMRPIGSGLGYPERVRPAPDLGTFTIADASRYGDHMTAVNRFAAILRDLAQQDCPGIPTEAQAA